MRALQEIRRGGPLLLSMFLLPVLAHAVIPTAIDYQGYLTDINGRPITATVEIDFCLYPTDTATSALWCETHIAVNVVDGLFSVSLDVSTANPPLDFSIPYYLGINVGGDGEMQPRRSLGLAPYAARAIVAETAEKDSDTLATLNCTLAQQAVFNGREWVCANLLTYSGTDFALSGQACTDGSVVTGVDAVGGIACAVDRNAIYTAGTGINISKNIITNTGDTSAADDLTIATLFGGDLVGTFDSLQLVASSVGSAEIVDNSVTAEDLIDGAGSGVDADMLDGMHASAFVGIIGGTIDGNLKVTGALATDTGVRFPDGSQQTRAVYLPGRVVVDQVGGGDYKYIQAAIDAINPTANNPYVVEVRPGIYVENIVMKSHVHLKGAGMNSTTIRPQSSPYRAVTLPNLTNVKVSGFTFEGGPPPFNFGAGTGIHDISSSPVVTENRFARFNSGAGVYSDASSPQIYHNEFVQTDAAGVWLTNASNGRVTDNTIDLNYKDCGISIVNSGALVSRNVITNQTRAGVCSRVTAPGLPYNLMSVMISDNEFFAANITIDSSFTTEIVGNHINSGVVTTAGTGGLRIVGNRILGFIENGARDAEIIGNEVVGTPQWGIYNKGLARIIGNTISGTPAVFDEGQAEIVGNRIYTTVGVGISAANTTDSVIFANRVDQNEPDVIGQRIVTPTGIRLESTADSIVISAGGSEIKILPTGEVSIQGGQAVSIAAAGALTLSGDTVKIEATTQLDLRAGTNMAVRGGANTNISAGNEVDITGDALVDINSGQITLN